MLYRHLYPKGNYSEFKPSLSNKIINQKNQSYEVLERCVHGIAITQKS